MPIAGTTQIARHQRRMRRELRRAKSAAIGLRRGMKAGAGAKAPSANLSIRGHSPGSAARAVTWFSCAVSNAPRNKPIKGVATQETQSQMRKQVSKDIAISPVGQRLGFRD